MLTTGKYVAQPESCLKGMAAAAALVIGITFGGPAQALSLQDAIKVAVEANPEIGEAKANREAIEFELRQAKGLYLPKVDVEARYGAQQLDSPATRAANRQHDTLGRQETDILLTQTVFDGFNRRGERHRQAARVDGASHRVWERSEFIAVNVVREYIEAVRAHRVVEIAKSNIAYHEKVLSNLKEGTSGGSISVADRQQAEERLYAARARLEESIEDLNAAKIRFFRLVGKPFDNPYPLPAIARALPHNLENALAQARNNNPLVYIAKADIDAAAALIKQARSEYLPKISLELRGRAGDDLDGVPGQETELRAEVVARWNVFKGGIDHANVQEQVRRVDEERFGLHRVYREVEERMRLSWDRRAQQSRRLNQLNDQLGSANRLIESYGEQFKVGDRSLLDLLDSQNTRFNAQVAVETANAAYMFEQFRILAHGGVLLTALNIPTPSQASAYARPTQKVPETPDAETQKRWSPDKGLIGLKLRPLAETPAK
ncbi:MAG: TolC family outer membrane protein [Pseudomonadota bacterium]|nr:TolC family outer membrane protein [Pseudomonadota bacterium]